MSIYIDGLLDNQTAETRASDSLTSWETCIGDDSYSCGTVYGDSPWIGQIDQISIYDYARTSAQISYDYNRGGPIGWWKFDECQGSIANDSSGIGNNGSINIGPSGTQNSIGTCTVGTSAAWTNGTTGKINSSLNFDGTDDYVSIPSSTSLQLGQASGQSLSVSAWYFKTSASTNQKIIMKGSSNSSTNTDYTLFIENGSLKWGTGSSSDNCAWLITTEPSTNTWHHIVGTITQSTATTGSKKLYIDGQQISNCNYTTKATSSTDPVFVGSAIGPANYFGGKIDDVRVYNYPLTATQVKTLYNNGAINFH